MECISCNERIEGLRRYLGARSKNETIEIPWADFETVINIIDAKCDIQSFDYILAITRGGWIPSVILAHKHGKEVLPFQIRLTENDGINAVKTKPVFGQNIDFSILKNKKLLVIDDVFGSGATLSYVKKEILKFDPATVLTATCYINTNNYGSLSELVGSF